MSESRNMSEQYTSQEVYDAIRSSTELPDTCGCSVIGLITVRDCKGNVLGLLTPQDAEEYQNSVKEVPVGFVKVFHPVTNEFLGVLETAQAQEYITFLLSTVTP